MAGAGASGAKSAADGNARRANLVFQIPNAHALGPATSTRVGALQCERVNGPSPALGCEHQRYGVGGRDAPR